MYAVSCYIKAMSSYRGNVFNRGEMSRLSKYKESLMWWDVFCGYTS